MHLRISSKKPAIAMLILATAIPELLTGSTPITFLVLDPGKFALQMLLNIGLYGSGALLIREASSRWNKGWATILLLGAAYGIMEEGIAVHTFFQPSGNPVGVLGAYGRAFGVNWVWAAGLTVFHSLYSISIPILIVELIYPQFKKIPWMDSGLLGLTMFTYLGDVALLFAAVPNKPNMLQLVFFLAIVILLLIAAYKAPSDFLRARPGPTRGNRLVLTLAGMTFFASWMVVIVMASANLLPPILSIAFLFAASAVSMKAILSRVGDRDNELAKLTVVTGFLAVLFMWDVVMEFVAVPGILFVTAPFIYLLVRIRRSVNQRSIVAPAHEPQPL